MSLYIHTNLYSANAARSVNLHLNNMGQSIKRLSSGLRINTADDDPSGKAIREMMRGDIATMRRGITNTQMAVSMVQTAESAMAGIDRQLIRMKELAEQASTGTYTQEQRLILNSEFQMMAWEIDRIASTTKFSNVHLLDGSVSTGSRLVENSGWFRADSVENYAQPNHHFTRDENVKIHFGVTNNRAEDYYYVQLTDMRTRSLFRDFVTDQNTNLADVISISSQHSAQIALDQLNSAIAFKDLHRAQLGSVQNRLEATLNQSQINLENIQSAESKISDIDVADEMSKFMKNQVLSQAATAMLTQANNVPKIVLRLLQ